MNTQDSLICGEVPSNYYYNPFDGQGFHNHKGFSVHVEGNIIWAGTADGVNKGLIREDGCIDWYHYTFPADENIENDVDGNWIIGIIPNYTTDEYGNIVTRIWLVSWTLTGPAPHNLYYTDNEGETWNKISDLVDEGAIAYDISIYTFGGIFGLHAYIASDYGIYVSVPSDIQNLFSKLDIPEIVIEPLGTEKVYTTLWDSNQDGYVLETDNLWIGSPAGLLSYNNLTDTWNTPFVLDENTFNNPDEYNPDRWSNKDVKEQDIVFGLGNQQCPSKRITPIYYKTIIYHLLKNFNYTNVSPKLENKTLYFINPYNIIFSIE